MMITLPLAFLIGGLLAHFLINAPAVRPHHVPISEPLHKPELG